MKQAVTTNLKTMMADRAFFSLLTAVVVTALLYAVYVALSVESRDIQIVTHYSGFGESHFYRAPWYSLYTFAAMGLVIGVTNAAAMAKLYAYDRRIFAMYVGWLTLTVLAIAAVWTYKVFGVAYL